jgi:hypothetical protein
MTGARVQDLNEAGVILVAGYLHLNKEMGRDKRDLLACYEKYLNNKMTKASRRCFYPPSVY